MEFKLNGTKEDALQQIKDTKYYERYMNEGEKIVLVGAQIDTSERSIKDWVREKM